MVSLGIGYYGYRLNEHWTGALTGLIGYKLAKTNNIASGASGVAILTALGALQLTKPFWAGGVKEPTQPPYGPYLPA